MPYTLIDKVRGIFFLSSNNSCSKNCQNLLVIYLEAEKQLCLFTTDPQYEVIQHVQESSLNYVSTLMHVYVDQVTNTRKFCRQIVRQRSSHKRKYHEFYSSIFFIYSFESLVSMTSCCSLTRE